MAYERVPFYWQPEWGIKGNRIDNTTLQLYTVDSNKVLSDGKIVIKSEPSWTSNTLYESEVIPLYDLQVNQYDINLVDYIPAEWIKSSSNTFMNFQAVDPKPAPKMVNITLNLDGVSCTLLNKETNEQQSLIYNEPKEIVEGTYDISLMVIDKNYDIVSAVIDIDQSPLPSNPYNFTISNDKKSAVFSLDMYNYTYINSVIIRGKLEKGEGVPDISGTFNNLYQIDSENLRTLTNNVVLKEKDNPIQHYIINLVRIPFKLDDSIIGGDEGIIIGNEVFTSPSSKKLKVDKISVDLGSIEIPYKYNNSYDFLNTNCYLHLPFSQTIELDSSYVIGETISIKYELSLYDGAGTINIYSSKIGDVFLSVAVKVGVTIPYFNKGNDGYSSKNIELLNIYNNLKSAYMEVIRNIPYNRDSPFNSDIITQTVLKNEKGYVKVNNIILESKASFDEKNKIINLLNQGVYIK